MLAAMESARDRELRHLYLEVAEDNVAARRLYRKMGFMQVGRRRGYYKRAQDMSVDALTLRREIIELPPNQK